MTSRSGRRPWLAGLGTPLVTGVAVGASLLAGCAQGSSAGAADTVVSGSASASADTGVSVSAAPSSAPGSVTAGSGAPDSGPPDSGAPGSVAPDSTSPVPSGPAATPDATSPAPTPSASAVVPSSAAPTAVSRAPTTPTPAATPGAGTHPSQQPGHNPLTGLPGVPAGFTLPPGYDILKSKPLDGGTEILLTAPKVAVSIPYLRAELTRRGYRQVLQKKTGAITAWAYSKGSSIISISGGVVDEVNATAVIFAKP